jgi:spore germination protein GerM
MESPVGGAISGYLVNQTLFFGRLALLFSWTAVSGIFAQSIHMFRKAIGRSGKGNSRRISRGIAW